jgi:hypothetical protein
MTDLQANEFISAIEELYRLPKTINPINLATVSNKLLAKDYQTALTVFEKIGSLSEEKKITSLFEAIRIFEDFYRIEAEKKAIWNSRTIPRLKLEDKEPSELSAEARAFKIFSYLYQNGLLPDFKQKISRTDLKGLIAEFQPIKAEYTKYVQEADQMGIDPVNHPKLENLRNLMLNKFVNKFPNCYIWMNEVNIWKFKKGLINA